MIKAFMAKLHRITVEVLIYLFITTTAVATVSWASVFTYWQFADYEPIRVDALMLDKYEAQHGEKVCFSIHGEKYVNIPSKVSIELVDGEAIHLMSYMSHHPPGVKFRPRCFLVPPHAVPKSHYVVRWTATYQVNPIRDVVVTKDSAFISVKEAI